MSPTDFPRLLAPRPRATILAEDERSKKRVLAAQGWSFVLAAKLATKFDDAPTARLAADRAVTAGGFRAPPGLPGGAPHQLARAPGGGGGGAPPQQGARVRAGPPPAGGPPDPPPV